MISLCPVRAQANMLNNLPAEIYALSISPKRELEAVKTHIGKAKGNSQVNKV
jgi:hypothetical protein